MFIFMFEVCGESVLNTNLSIEKIAILKPLSCSTEPADQNSESLEFFCFFFMIGNVRYGILSYLPTSVFFEICFWGFDFQKLRIESC